MDRRSYLSLTGAGLGTILAGCSDRSDDGTGSDPTTSDDTSTGAGTAEPTDPPEGATPPELRVLDVTTGGRDAEGRLELQAAPGTPVRITAIVPTLHDHYEVAVALEFRRDEAIVFGTTHTIEGTHETSYTREGVERTETVHIDTTLLSDEAFELLVTIEDLRLSGGETASATEPVVVHWPRWRERVAEAEALVDDALDEFVDDSDGTILDAGFDTFDRLAAVRTTSDARDALETAADAVPPDVDPGPVFDRLSVEIELVRGLARAHGDLVDIFDDIRTLRELVDTGATTGRLRRRIESAQDDVEAELNAIDESHDELLAVAETGALRSERYGEKIEQLEDHLSISRSLVDSLTQFQAAEARIRRARDATGLGRQTHAERAIVRLDFFVRGVANDPHESIEGLLDGVAHLDPHGSIEDLIDGIEGMASERESEARQLRREGIDEAE